MWGELTYLARTSVCASLFSARCMLVVASSCVAKLRSGLLCVCVCHPFELSNDSVECAFFFVDRCVLIVVLACLVCCRPWSCCGLVCCHACFLRYCCGVVFAEADLVVITFVGEIPLSCGGITCRAGTLYCCEQFIDSCRLMERRSSLWTRMHALPSFVM